MNQAEIDARWAIAVQRLTDALTQAGIPAPSWDGDRERYREEVEDALITLLLRQPQAAPW